MLKAARNVQAALPASRDEVYVIVGVDRETVVDAELRDHELVYPVSIDGDGTVRPARGAEKTYCIREEQGALPTNRTLAEAVETVLAPGSIRLLPDRERSGGVAEGKGLRSNVLQFVEPCAHTV